MSSGGCGGDYTDENQEKDGMASLRGNNTTLQFQPRVQRRAPSAPTERVHSAHNAVDIRGSVNAALFTPRQSTPRHKILPSSFTLAPESVSSHTAARRHTHARLLLLNRLKQRFAARRSSLCRHYAQHPVIAAEKMPAPLKVRI